MRFPETHPPKPPKRLQPQRLLGFLLCLLVGCGTGREPSLPSMESPGQDHRTDDQRTGYLCRTFISEQEQSHPYVLFVPHHFQPGMKLPVLMFLNGRGENGEDGVRQISNNFGQQIWDMQEFFPFLVIAPQCRANGSWSPNSEDTQAALAILDEVIEEFDADWDRVYLTGVSAGGSGAWMVASAYPERFAAVAPLAGSGANAQQLTAARMPIWNFYNDGDAQGLVESNRRIRDQLIKQGMSPQVMEFHRSGHNCWDVTYHATALYGWLLEQNRSNNAGQKLFEYLPPSRILSEWTAIGMWRPEGELEYRLQPVQVSLKAGLQPEDGEDLVLIGKGSENENLLISNVASAEMELHGDLWLSSSVPVSVPLLLMNGDSSEAQEEFQIWIMLPHQGTGGISRTADGAWLADFYGSAEHWLQADLWNDVRVRLAHGELEVRLNGWPAARVTLEPNDAEADTAKKYRFALAAPKEVDSDVRWRYLRMRDLNDGEGTTEARRHGENQGVADLRSTPIVHSVSSDH